MSGVTASADVIALLLRALVLDVFDEHDATRRAAAIGRVFVEDADFVDPGGTHRGHADIEAAVVKLHERLPGYRFRLTSEPQMIDGGGRVTWAFGPAGEPPRVTGMDVIRVRGERVALLMTFLDPPAPGNAPQ